MLNSAIKTYFKIFAITLIIQITGFCLAYFTDELLWKYDTSTVFPVIFMTGGVLISTILGIILPIVWGRTRRQKLLMLFLLPTNYTWLAILFLIIYSFHHIVEILTNLPANFG